MALINAASPSQPSLSINMCEVRKCRTKDCKKTFSVKSTGFCDNYIRLLLYFKGKNLLPPDKCPAQRNGERTHPLRGPRICESCRGNSKRARRERKAELRALGRKEQGGEEHEKGADDNGAEEEEPVSIESTPKHLQPLPAYKPAKVLWPSQVIKQNSSDDTPPPVQKPNGNILQNCDLLSEYAHAIGCLRYYPPSFIKVGSRVCPIIVDEGISAGDGALETTAISQSTPSTEEQDLTYVHGEQPSEEWIPGSFESMMADRAYDSTTDASSSGVQESFLDSWTIRMMPNVSRYYGKSPGMSIQRKRRLDQELRMWTVGVFDDDDT